MISYKLISIVFFLFMIDLEEIMSSKVDKKSQIMTFACLEQPETLDYLNFLKSESETSNSKATFSFNSEPD